MPRKSNSESSPLGLADDRFNQRLRLRLTSSSEALQALEAQYSIGRRLAERFRLGLSEAYPKSSSAQNCIHKDLLVAPLLGSDGRFYSRYVYRSLAGISVDNRIDPPTSWSAGASEWYFSRKREPEDSVIVCDDIVDLWAIASVILDTPLERTHVVIAPTQRDAWPDVWQSKGFWESWKRVNIALTASSATGTDGDITTDRRARQLARRIGRDTNRLLPHSASSWREARLNGLRYDVFHRLLKNATVLKAVDLAREDVDRYASAAGEDLSCSYQRGFLFEAIEVLERTDNDGQPMERLKTVVVRSDRTLHLAKEVPSPPGTPKAGRVYRLAPDGALLRRPPTPSSDATWRWPSVSAYLYEDASSPPLIELIDQIVAHLKTCVWLPFECEYWLLACVVVATYCQQIFDAVPLVLVTGPKGSGKTNLSSVISRLCANSPGPIGLISARTLTRLADATHGFLAIDDLEQVFSTRNDGLQFNDLAQALKLSYKKESARRMLTDVNQNNQLQRMNFFGIKLINNTRGVDEILGSRMLTISTRQMPCGLRLGREGKLTSEECAHLRDHLHVWAFTHVAEIARSYVEICPDVATREDEIATPIRVLAQMSGSEHLIGKVGEALGTSRTSNSTSPTEAMEEALLSILTKAITNERRLPIVATILETQMRLELREGRDYGKARTTDISDIQSPEWIGRQFKDVFAPIGADPLRVDINRRGTRFYPLSKELLDKALAATNTSRDQLTEDSNPRAFCASCGSCDYQSFCEMRDLKMKADARSNVRARKADGRAENPTGEAGLH